MSQRMFQNRQEQRTIVIRSLTEASRHRICTVMSGVLRCGERQSISFTSRNCRGAHDEEDCLTYCSHPDGCSPRQLPSRGAARSARAGGGPVLCRHPRSRRPPSRPRCPRRACGSGERRDADRGSAGAGRACTGRRSGQSSITYSPLPSLANNRLTESGVVYDTAAGTGPGNVTAIGGQTLTYDAFNQVITKSANGTTPPDYTYIYDVNEERIGVQYGNTTHWTIRDFDNKPLIAFDSPPPSATQTQWTSAESVACAG